MSSTINKTADDLRMRAEALIAESTDTAQRSDLKTIKELAHELAVHQAELELQNEELLETQLTLQETKDRFVALFEHAPVGYVVLDSSGIIRQANTTWRIMVNREDEDFRGSPFADAIFSEDAPVFLARFRTFFRNPAEKQIIVRMKRKGRSPFFARIEAEPQVIRQNEDAGSGDELMIIVSDITNLQEARLEIENKNLELGKVNERLDHINRVLLAIRNVNQLIVQESDPNRLIEQACTNLTETMGYYSAWIALLNIKDTASPTTAASGFGLDFEVMHDGILKGEYPSCMRHALDLDETVVVNNPKIDCPDCPLSSDYDGRAGLVRRLSFDGKTYGILAVSVPSNYACSTEDQDLFKEVAGDLAFALHKIEMEKRLAESQGRYLQIFERSRDGFVMVDKAGHIIDANRAYCDMLGYSLDELRAMPDFYRITPERWRAWEAEEIWEKRLLVHGYSGLYEKEYIRKDGSIFLVELRSYTVRREDGEIDYLWGTARDITDRKQFEMALRESEKKFRNIFSDISDAVFIHDMEGHFLEVNDVACKRLGYSRDELLRMSPFDIDVSEFGGQAQERMQSIRLKGQLFFDSAHRRKDGSELPVEIHSRKIQYEGKPCILSVARDVTERKQAESLLRESERYLRSIVETSADGFWTIDRKGLIVEVNDAYCLMAGYTREEILGMNIGDLDAYEGPADTAARIERIIADGSELFETYHRRKDGSVWPVEISASWLNELGGRFVCFGRDLTERRQQEERLALLGRMLDEAPAAITIHKTDGHFLYVNDQTISLHGYSDEEEFLSVNLHELDVPESEALLAERFRSIAETGEARFEVAHYRKDGSTFPLEVLAKAIEWQGQQAILSIAADITERKLVAEALEASEERFRDVVSNLPGAVFQFIRKQDGSIVIPFMSEGAIGIFERSVEETQDASRLFEDMHPDDLPRMWDSIEKSAQNMSPWELEFRLLFGDRIKWLRGVSSPKALPDGGICWNGMLIDVTQTKQTEEMLWQSEERFRTLFESLSAGSCIDKIIYENARAIDYRILDVNPAYEKIMGISREKAKNALGSQIYGTGKAPFLDTLARVAETGEPERFETFFEPIKRHLEFTVSRPAKGLFSTVFFDITERKQTEDALKESELFLSETQKVARLGGWKANPLTDELKWTDGVYDIIEAPRNYRPGLAEGLKFFCPEYLPAIQGGLNSCFNDGRSFSMEVEIITEKSNRRWVELRGFSRQDKREEQFIKGTIQDISERKKTEEEKQKLQNQLLQAQKMESIGILAGGISHDFNNLLQVISGYTDILLMDKTEKDSEYQTIKTIQEAGFRATDLVQQLLLFSRKAESKMRPIELQQEVERARKILERTIPKMIHIQVHTGDRLWTVNADPIQVEQMLLNLASNAADAMPEGGQLVIEIENTVLDEEYARYHLGAKPGNYVLLTVSDTGQGIDNETLEHIFDPFFTTKEFGKGTGLGLASVYGIVKSHGGYITCYSEVGIGTTFKIYFPAILQPEIQETEDFKPKPVPKGTETILLVDDEEAIRGFAKQALMKFGYRVLTASTGEEAIEVYSSNSNAIDLIVMDVGMPGMGGHKCLQELLRKDQAIKVVIASGYSIHDQVKKSMEAGAKAYVGKPYQMADLLNTVRAVLDEKV